MQHAERLTRDASPVGHEYGRFRQQCAGEQAEADGGEYPSHFIQVLATEAELFGELTLADRRRLDRLLQRLAR